MNRGLIILVAAVILGVGMFFGSQQMLKPCNCGDTIQVPVENGSLLPELQWLRRSLHLTDAQFEKVRALHVAYKPKCAELCLRVQHADQALQEAASRSRTVTEDVIKLMSERTALAQECQQAMLRHVYETAGCMEQGQANDYLKVVLAHVLASVHSSH